MTQDTGHHPSIHELRVGTVVIGRRVRGGRKVVSHLVEEGWREGYGVLAQSVNHARSVEVGR